MPRDVDDAADDVTEVPAPPAQPQEVIQLLSDDDDADDDIRGEAASVARVHPADLTEDDQPAVAPPLKRAKHAEQGQAVVEGAETVAAVESAAAASSGVKEERDGGWPAEFQRLCQLTFDQTEFTAGSLLTMTAVARVRESRTRSGTIQRVARVTRQKSASRNGRGCGSESRSWLSAAGWRRHYSTCAASRSTWWPPATRRCRAFCGLGISHGQLVRQHPPAPVHCLPCNSRPFGHFGALTEGRSAGVDETIDLVSEEEEEESQGWIDVEAYILGPLKGARPIQTEPKD